MTIKTVALSLIHADQSAQPRAAISEELVNEYAKDMKRGDVFPPLVVFCENAKTYWLSRGFHRLEAKKRSGAKEVECDVRKGALRDAILHSCGANAAHGLRRSNADKRNAVTKLLKDKEWSKWSDSDIAKRCCVGPDLVADVRKELKSSLSDSDSEKEGQRTYKSKSGTITTMKTGKIGKSPRPVPQRSPEARAIAREVAKQASDAMASVFEARKTPDSSPPPSPPVASPKPAPAEPNGSERREQLFGRLHDIAEELDRDQSERLRSVANELNDELETLRSFALITIKLSMIFEVNETKLPGGDKELLRKWAEIRLRVEPLVIGNTSAPAGVEVATPAPTEPAGALSMASPAQDIPGGDGLDIPASLRREPGAATDRGLQHIGSVIDQVIKH
jgi:ParB-like nuclease domain